MVQHFFNVQIFKQVELERFKVGCGGKLKKVASADGFFYWIYPNI